MVEMLEMQEQFAVREFGSEGLAHFGLVQCLPGLCD